MKRSTAIAAALAGAFIFLGPVSQAAADCAQMRWTIRNEIHNLEHKLAMKQIQQTADPTGGLFSSSNKKLNKIQHRINVLKAALRDNVNCPEEGRQADRHNKKKSKRSSGGGPGIVMASGGGWDNDNDGHHKKKGKGKGKGKNKKKKKHSGDGGGCAC